MAGIHGKQNEKSWRFQRVRTPACNMRKINLDLHHVGGCSRNIQNFNAESQQIFSRPRTEQELILKSRRVHPSDPNGPKVSMQQNANYL